MEDSVLIQLLENQKNDLMTHIDLTGTATRGKIESEVNRVDEMNVIRNGRIEALEDEYDDLHDWQTKSKTRDRVVWLGMSGALTYLGAVIIRNWDKIFN